MCHVIVDLLSGVARAEDVCYSHTAICFRASCGPYDDPMLFSTQKVHKFVTLVVRHSRSASLESCCKLQQLMISVRLQETQGIGKQQAMWSMANE